MISSPQPLPSVPAPSPQPQVFKPSSQTPSPQPLPPNQKASIPLLPSTLRAFNPHTPPKTQPLSPNSVLCLLFKLLPNPNSLCSRSLPHIKAKAHFYINHTFLHQIDRLTSGQYKIASHRHYTKTFLQQTDSWTYRHRER